MNDENPPPDLVSIRFLSGPLAGQTVPIRNPSVTIGRGASNDIVVKGDQKVSRTHAQLLWHDGSWSIQRLAPQNTLTVNEQQVQQATITNNTTIGLGEDTSFLFLVEPKISATLPPLDQTLAISSPLQQTPSRPLYPVQPQQRSREHIVG